MKRLLSLWVVGGCLVALLGCGGGGGSKKSGPGVASAASSLTSSASSSNMNLVTVRGKVYIQGALSNATVTLVKLGSSADEVVYTGEINSNGEFVHNLEQVDPLVWYQYKATSGTDTVSGLPNHGTIQALIKGSSLQKNKSSIQLNPVTDLLARLAVNGALDQADIANKLDTAIQYLIEDINQDGHVNSEDLMAFDYKNHQDKLIIANEDLRKLYIPALIEQVNDANSINLDKMIVAVLRPEIVVPGGQIIEPPSSLIPHLNKPIPGQVRWLLNDTEADSITIQDVGNYRITAKIVNKSGQVISHITTPLYAASREMLSSLDLSATATEVQQLNIYQDTERDHDLVGASVAVPPGAVAENVTVSMAAIDIPYIPLIEGTPVGGVLSMQPSGQVFNQGVEIGMPYDPSVVTPDEIRVARHSAGVVDYLVPDYIDTENHIVYFQTSHFTEFQLTKYWRETDAAKTDLPEIKKIAAIHNIHLTDEEWQSVLNYSPSGGIPSVYDLFLTWKMDKKLADIINSGTASSYIDAYKYFYVESEGKWRSPLGVLDIGLETAGIIDTYSQSKNAAILTASKDYWTATRAVAFGVMDKVISLSANSFVGWYVEELIHVGDKAIGKINDDLLSLQIKTYFSFRKAGYGAYEISEALGETIGTNEMSNLKGIADAYGKNGWFYFAYSPVNQVMQRNQFWSMVEFLYVRYSAYSEETTLSLISAIKYAKQELDSAENPYIIINNNQSPLLSNGICSGSTTHLDISLASYGEKLSSPAAILKDKDSREVQSVIASDKCSQKLGQWSCSYQQKMPSVQTEKNFNYELKVMDGDLSGTLNYSVMVQPLIKHDVEQLHLGSVEYIPGYYLIYSGINLKGNQFYNAKYQLNAIESDGKALLVDNDVIKIPEAEFGALALDRVAITVSAATNASCQTINQKKFEIDINDVIRQYAEANKPVVQLMSVNGATVNNVSSMLEAPQNSVVIFSVRVANGVTITTYAMGGTTTQSKSAPKDTKIIGGTIYQIPYRFNNAGEFLPWVLVKMPNGDLHRANAPRIRIIEANKQIDQNAPVVIPENLPPQANAGSDQQLRLKQTVLLTGAQSKDVDGYITYYRWYRSGKFVGSGAQLSIGNLPIGSHVFTLEVIDNAGATSTDVVNITIIGPRIEASSSISFDSVPIGQSKTLPLTIRNSGNAELTGISLSLNSAEFQISSMPSRLATGAQAVVQVTFTPEAEVPSSAAITIKSNELADESVLLSGNGIANKLLVRVIPSATTLRVNDELKLRIEITDGNPAYKVNINWGDGSQGTYDSSQSEIFASHTYTSEAINTLKITVTDFANKASNYTAEITVSNVAVTKTAWAVDARHIGTNEYAANIPVTVSPTEVDGNILQTFTTSWKPKSGSDNNYFVKYRLPVPPGVIKLTNNVRMTVIMSASNVASFDRELAFVTDKGELAASWIAEVEPPIPGYIRVKDFDGDDRKYESGLLNDDPQLKPIQSYAIEWRASGHEFSAQRYANSSYSLLGRLGDLAQNLLNEINITFKGNGKIYLVKLEYDKNGNGEYDDGYIVANTADSNTNWSVYSDEKYSKISEQVKISDQKFADCLDATGARFPDEITHITCDGVSISGDELRVFKNLNFLHLANSTIQSVNWSDFKSLQTLYLMNVPLANLELAGNNGIRSLSLVNNDLAFVDVSRLSDLEHLSVNENPINRIDLSNNMLLTHISIYKTQVEMLNVKGLDKLERIYVSWNKLKELSLGNHPKLNELYADAINYPNDSGTEMIINNELTSIDVAGCPSLERLSLTDNLISDIDLSKNTKLKYLALNKRGTMFDGDIFQGISYLNLKNLAEIEEIYVSGHALSSLDLSGNPHLVKLGVSGTNLSSLDVSMLNKLTLLNATGANLTSIEIGNLTDLKELYVSNNNISILDISKNLSLDTVWASKNKLISVTGIEGLSKSTYIHLSENMFDRDTLAYLNDLRNSGYTQLYASSILKSSSSATSSSSSSPSSRSSSSKSSASSIGNHVPLDKSAWVASSSCHWANPLCDTWLVFLDDAKYFSIQTTQPDEGCTVGIETGSYARSAVTGAFQATPQFDGNNHCGVSDASEETTLVLNGNQLSYKEEANSTPVNFNKAPAGSSHKGTWILSEGNHTEVLALDETTFIRAIYKNGVEDVELGYYSYNQNTGEFQITSFSQDKNTANSGFTGASNINLVVNNNQLTLTTGITPGNPAVFSRLQ